MKHIIVIFIFLTFISIKVVNSQVNYNSKRTIVWENKISFRSINEEESEKFYLLSFKNASYFDESTFFPYYSEIINLSEEKFRNGQIKVKIENSKFVELENSEKQNVKNLPKLSNKISITNNISHSRGISFLQISFIPLRKNKSTGKIEKLISFTLRVTETSPYKNERTKVKYAKNSVLSSGKWVKIGILHSGIYKMTYSELQELGFSSPQNVRVFGNDAGELPLMNNEYRDDDLVENKIFKGSDYILFYAKGANTWTYSGEKEMFRMHKHSYSDTAYYFLTDKNTGFDNSIQTENQSTEPETFKLTSYDFYTHYENDEENILGSGRIWIGNQFSYQLSQNFSFTFPNLINNSEIKLNTSVVGRTSVTSTFSFSQGNLNETVIISKCGEDDIDANYARENNSFYTYSAGSSDNINLNITYNQGTASAEGWLNYITYNAKCELIFTNGQFGFRNKASVGLDNVTNFEVSNAGSGTTVWDITDSRLPRKINITNSGSISNFKIETDSLREFIAFDGSTFYSPSTNTENTGEISNQNLHSTSQNTDMIIITHPLFLSQAQEIAQIHESHDNMLVKVATIEQVYNEFSSGAPDVSAIRDYVRFVYEKSSYNLKYLLLMGDGSYDNKSYASNNSNFILTFQSKNSFNSNGNRTIATDDFFGFLDADEGGGNIDQLKSYMLDVGIGRMPVKTPTEATDMVNKIYSYLDPDNRSDWTNVLCFVGDDDDSNQHMGDVEEHSVKIDTLYPYFNIKKVYLDAYPQESTSAGESYPEAVIELNNRINKGALIVNYAGHGSPKTLAHERLVTINDINNWTNFEHLSLFITATCEFCRFDQKSDNFETATSAGERVFLSPNGGAIAMFTTTRVTLANANSTLNSKFYDYMFEDDETDTRYRLGDIYRLGKNGYANSKNKLAVIFLGDPALQLAYGEQNIVTTSINGSDVRNEQDTISALSKVTIAGEVQNKSGQLLTDFNGIIYPTVFDKSKLFKTLGNEDCGVFTYFYQNNVLFKGRARVSNGIFSFTFIVPKDIYYNYGRGKISYYAKSTLTDAKGYFNNFIVGGTSDNAQTDIDGPSIKLFLNDSSFINGGMTDQNPLIYAFLNDTNGINTAGSGIGHDITATLDDNTNQAFILNDYYEADLGSYQKGKVEYGLFKLEPGEHALKFKAWDVYNNSSEAELDFVVFESTEFTINRLFNYPNPFTTNTSFYFEHNQPGTELEVLLQIFTVSGKLVRTIQSQMVTTGFRSEAISWDGLDDYGSPIGRGVYIYRVKVRTKSGKIVEKYEKLLILN